MKKILILLLLTFAASAQTITFSDFNTRDHTSLFSSWNLDSTWALANSTYRLKDQKGSQDLTNPLGTIPLTTQYGDNSPLYIGGNAIEFISSSNDYLAGSFADTVFAFIMWVKMDSVIDVSETRGKIASFSASNDPYFAYGSSSGSMANELIATGAAGTRSYYANASGSINATWHVVGFRWNETGSVNEIWFDGALLATQSVGTNTYMIGSGVSRPQLMAYTASAQYSDGFLAKTNLFDKEITAIDMNEFMMLPAGWESTNGHAVRERTSGTWAFNIGAVSDTIKYATGLSGRYIVSLDAHASNTDSLRVFTTAGGTVDSVGTAAITRIFEVNFTTDDTLRLAPVGADSVWWDNIQFKAMLPIPASGANRRNGGYGEY